LTGAAAGAAKPESGASNPRFLLFDSLRAIAALCVFCAHLPWVYRLASGDPARSYLQELTAGVAVFFLISGFLLYRPFARARYSEQEAPELLPYAARRALRIFPAYWAALLGAVILVGATGEAVTATRVFTVHGVFAYFPLLQVYDSSTLLGGISAAWTLSVELSFYALLPLWALLLRRVPFRSAGGFVRTELIGLGVLFAIGLAWTGVAASQGPPPTAALVDVTLVKPWLYVLPAYLDQFALGMGLAVLSVALAERAKEPAFVRTLDRAPWLSWLAAGLAFVLLGNVVDWIPGHTGEVIAVHELQGLFALGLLLPAVFGNPKRGAVRRALGSRVLLWTGLVSYGIYLWHVAIMRNLADAGLLDSLGNAAFTIVALTLTLLAAAASFYWLERPALRLGRRLSRRRRSQDADMRMRDVSQHERPEPGTS
jgi:peptidoglycan/LPS O-acetylase OafA/YrhL